MDRWWCLDLAALFNAKVNPKYEKDYAECQYGSINRTRNSAWEDNFYYDFGTTDMPRLCCDGEQCKVIKIENNVVTLVSDGNSYEDNVKDYYFKLSAEEAEIAGINIKSCTCYQEN